ncbi:unnamed protein product [Schistocephalus solidus]|uniref:Death domain-containing protein n=1 Tax=Schistocephalus solidus TaxID=70667 RepID=A0A183TQC0_SCHSO|nr:unnamed protein product [Schistocephalus solidus]
MMCRCILAFQEDNWLKIVRTLHLLRPANFTGSVEHCQEESFEFSITDPGYDPREIFSLLEHAGEIDASVILRRILEGGLQHKCENGSQNRTLYSERLELMV